VSAEDIFGRLSNAVRLEELTIEEEPAEPSASSADVRHVRCQVVPEFKGRVQDFMDALRKGRSDGEQAIFVASTTGRAERMIELARDYQVVATPADIDELVIVPDGVLWYLPFEALPAPSVSRGDTASEQGSAPLLMQLPIRYAPTLSLTVSDGRRERPIPRTAIVAGKPEESLLIRAVRQISDLKMPPTGKLPDTQLADFEEWIARGAADPRTALPALASATPQYKGMSLEDGRKCYQFLGNDLVAEAPCSSAALSPRSKAASSDASGRRCTRQAAVLPKTPIASCPNHL
jgi:hypothetical protein